MDDDFEYSQVRRSQLATDANARENRTNGVMLALTIASLIGIASAMSFSNRQVETPVTEAATQSLQPNSQPASPLPAQVQNGQSPVTQQPIAVQPQLPQQPLPQQPIAQPPVAQQPIAQQPIAQPPIQSSVPAQPTYVAPQPSVISAQPNNFAPAPVQP